MVLAILTLIGVVGYFVGTAWLKDRSPEYDPKISYMAALEAYNHRALLKAMDELGHIDPAKSDANSDTGLEMRLRAVEERLNQLESGVYAHGHRGEASTLRSVIKGVRDMEDVFRLFEAIDRGEIKLAEPPQTMPMEASISKPQTEFLAQTTPQAVSRDAELVFNILEAFAKGRAGGSGR